MPGCGWQGTFVVQAQQSLWGQFLAGSPNTGALIQLETSGMGAASAPMPWGANLPRRCAVTRREFLFA